MRTTTFLFAVLMSVVPLSGQTTLQPEFSDRAYQVTNDSTLTDLERADAAIDIKVKGLGYGGSETYYSVFTEHSAVRFSSGQLPRIVIKMDGNIDPMEKIIVIKAVIKKKRRRFLVDSRALGGKARDVSGVQVQISVKKLGNGVYELVFPNGLEPGEYAILPINTSIESLFSSNGKMKISCFGID